MTLTTTDMREIVADIHYDDWWFAVEENPEGRQYLQVRFLAPDMVTGEPETQHGRKWQLSAFMTRSEVVSTAFKAVLTAVEHEARETFRYKDRAIYGPHFDVDALATFAGDTDNIDMRTGAWVAQGSTT